MKRKIEIWDIYSGPVEENRGNIEKTEIELKELNDYVALDNFISFYVINNLIFISFDVQYIS